MFAKVVSKIATFAELLPTVFKLTPEVQFYSPGVGIFYLLGYLHPQVKHKQSYGVKVKKGSLIDTNKINIEVHSH